MTEDESIPALPETRSNRVVKVALALSECEQEELRRALQIERLSRLVARLADWQSCLVVGMHSGIIFGVTYGILMGLFSFISTTAAYGPVAGLIAFLFSTIILGTSAAIFMALVLAATYKLVYPYMLKNLTESKSSSFHVEGTELHLPLAESISLCRTVIEATPKTRLDKVDETNGELKASVRMSILSPGESVGVKLEAIDGERTHAKIYSKDLFNSWGLGKNRKNVKKLKAAIEEAADVHKILLEHKEGS